MESPMPTGESTPALHAYENISEESEPDRIETVIWMPEPLRGDKDLCLKYGVMVKETRSMAEMSREVYQAAYMEKIVGLIEGENDIPLPVLLDRFFTAPHLASGDPKQIAAAMWRELNEVREPVHLVGEWLEQRDEESFSRLIHPKSKKDLSVEPIHEDQLEADLGGLSLETFLELL
jgi:hypothetical protein